MPGFWFFFSFFLNSTCSCEWEGISPVLVVKEVFGHDTCLDALVYLTLPSLASSVWSQVLLGWQFVLYCSTSKWEVTVGLWSETCLSHLIWLVLDLCPGLGTYALRLCCSALPASLPPPFLWRVRYSTPALPADLLHPASLHLSEQVEGGHWCGPDTVACQVWGTRRFRASVAGPQELCGHSRIMAVSPLLLLMDRWVAVMPL